MANAAGPADPALPPHQGLTGQGDNDIPLDSARTNAVTAFVASPLLPEPNLIRVDHNATVLALAIDGSFHNEAVKLLAPAYSQQEAEAIWSA